MNQNQDLSPLLLAIMAKAASNAPEGTQPVAMIDKLDQVCALLKHLNLNPKSFMMALIEEDDKNAAVSQRYYSTERGWNSTERLILAFKRQACLRVAGHGLWEEFHPSTEARVVHNQELVDRMPFLYNLLCSKIEGPRGTSSLDCHADLVEERSDEDDDANSAEELANFDGLVLMKSRGPAMWRTNRVQNMAQTVCAMVAFGRNRRHNGLCSSRRMAHAALKALGKEADQKLKVRFNLNESPLLAPFLCYDNLDF
ncbi:hypothetical protein MJO28_000798 [Puccinia striiformis f. sp. tritici]|uniref:Uncharacterized protein n=1 Tax=Puccinia striiformis f. sp. tritici TaxID=168172 RepID=A0ACC0F0U9_9BASI|nr:hypothetical protein MJO28_000798 [Puccinia striiformis f. sp. tritici]